MSNLVKAIEAHRTREAVRLINEYPPLFNSVFDVQSTVTELKYEDCIQYRIVATFGSEVYVDQRSRESLGLAIERAKRGVIEAIFGEFRSDFILIEQALYNRNFKDATVLLREFERKMFSVETTKV